MWRWGEGGVKIFLNLYDFIYGQPLTIIVVLNDPVFVFQNIALIPTLTTAMKWFPRRKGTAMGFVVGGFGGGAMVFNQIQTAIVNPNNLGVRFQPFSQVQLYYQYDGWEIKRYSYILVYARILHIVIKCFV